MNHASSGNKHNCSPPSFLGEPGALADGPRTGKLPHWSQGKARARDPAATPELRGSRRLGLGPPGRGSRGLGQVRAGAGWAGGRGAAVSPRSPRGLSTCRCDPLRTRTQSRRWPREAEPAAGTGSALSRASLSSPRDPGRLTDSLGARNVRPLGEDSSPTEGTGGLAPALGTGPLCPVGEDVPPRPPGNRLQTQSRLQLNGPPVRTSPRSQTPGTQHGGSTAGSHAGRLGTRWPDGAAPGPACQTRRVRRGGWASAAPASGSSLGPARPPARVRGGGRCARGRRAAGSEAD